MPQAKVQKHKASHYAIHSEIEIDATPQQVWSVLTDTASYGDWAAFMVGITGEIAQDATITVDFQLNPAKPKRNTIDHKIHVTPGQEFYWAEKGPAGICDNHHFRVEATAEGKTRFVQHDEIMKGATWLLGGYLSKVYAKGYDAFNLSLKQEAERRARGD